MWMSKQAQAKSRTGGRAGKLRERPMPRGGVKHFKGSNKMRDSLGTKNILKRHLRYETRKHGRLALDSPTCTCKVNLARATRGAGRRWEECEKHVVQRHGNKKTHTLQAR